MIPLQAADYTDSADSIRVICVIRGSHLLEHPLRRGNLRVLDAGGRMERPGSRLKNGFGDVMLIAAVQILDVEVEAPLLNERLQKLFNQFRLEIPDAWSF